MRFVVGLVLVTGCGRLGFGSSEEIDASPPMLDAAPDAYVIPGTIARYSMDDDPADGVIADDSGGNRPARCVVGTSCPTQVPGRHGKALHFDGAVQNARITNDAVFATPNTFTIAVWVYLDDASADRVAVAKPHGPGSDDSWGFVAWISNMTCLETTSAGSQRHDACTGFSTPAGRWVHYAGTYDGNERVLYVDGVRAGQLVNSTPVVFDSHDIVIGGDENSGGLAYQWQGAIDELYIFDRALAPAEIEQLAAP